MECPGQRLKRIRERLKLTYRDVEEASQRIAVRLGPQFGIALSRLADIENKGAAPTIYRLYSLCAIYRLEMVEVLGWYGAPVDQLPAEALRIGLAATHAVHFGSDGRGLAPLLAERAIDPGKTTFLSDLVLGWGKTPLRFLHGMDVRKYRYGLIGQEDRSMYPILHPGALVLIDPHARIASGGWTTEHDRPVYFFERRDGYVAGWCDLTGDRLVLLPHPSSTVKPAVFRFPNEIELIGEVVGTAMLLESARRRRAQSAAARKASPNP